MKPFSEFSPAEKASIWKVINRTRYIVLGSIIGLLAVLIVLLSKLT